ncbi:ANTAR domain-containing protein [Amycolatopsis circi]|uniref:ANTAR domain-containing protein n=1 Tax=Amycolatopsis circi TaxID=871959 RepID=UPI000E237F92|nr:ANTAR domain-containing protein [Amycolatopsis circi]
MSLQSLEDAANAEAARLLRLSVAGRTTIDEAVGILQSAHGCDAEEALRVLTGDAGAHGAGAEAARLAEVADAAADGRADPDYGGWA